MTFRVKKIVEALPRCEKFADIGCDHGYVTLLMLESGKCRKAVISDVSEKCLAKAQKLLERHIANGAVRAVCCDGLGCTDPDADLVLIAGMGGMEIIRILENSPFVPPKICLQPMKNADKARGYLVSHGYRITRDEIIADGKFYDLITAERGEDTLTDKERLYGRTNLRDKPESFVSYIRNEIRKTENYLNRENLKEGTKERLLAKKRALEEVLCT